jgi:hypothetical protein
MGRGNVVDEQVEVTAADAVSLLRQTGALL